MLIYLRGTIYIIRKSTLVKDGSSCFLAFESDQRKACVEAIADSKFPMNKCAVPSCIKAFLGKQSEVCVVSEVRPLLTMHLDFIGFVTPEFGDRRVAHYLQNQLNGKVVCNGQPLELLLMGRQIITRIQCEPEIGKCQENTLLRMVTSNSVASNEPPVQNERFANIGGMSHVLTDILLLVHKPLKEYDKYLDKGLRPPRGILLHGPPGTGKTLIARSLIVELSDTHVVSINSTELTGVDSDIRIHEFFMQAKSEAKELGKSSLLLFIDEIDALCPQRDSSGGEAERRAVAALLTEMDGVSSSSDAMPFVVLGATNRINSLDIALRRPGRFEREIEVSPPDGTGRVEILAILSKTRFRKIWSPTELELKEIGNLTHGFVGADLVSLITHAAFQAINAGKQLLCCQDIIDSLRFVGPSALRELAITIPNTNWTDIGGYEDVKLQLKESVVWPIVHGHLFQELHVEPPKGVLLYGPPGCSKTMMARAVATESSMNFIAVKGPEIFSKWVGESEQAIRGLFRKARQASPCIIFFDEIDAIGSQRDSGSDGGVGSRVLTQLLTEMDGVSSLKQVVVIAATNRPHILDPALLRPGRFDRLVYVGLPDKIARSSIWETSLRRLPHTLSQEKGLDYLSQLSDSTAGLSGAEIVMIVKEAAVLCIREWVGCRTGDMHISQLDRQLDSLSLDSNQQPSLIVNYSHIQSVIEISPPRTDKNLIRVLEEFRFRSTRGK